MFIESITLTRMLPCLAEPGRIIVVGKPERPLDEVLPYLATLPNVIAYNPEARSLTFRRKTGFLTLYPDCVYITKVEDPAEGLELMQALVDAINTTWAHRDELKAVTTRHKSPGPKDRLACFNLPLPDGATRVASRRRSGAASPWLMFCQACANWLLWCGCCATASQQPNPSCLTDEVG